MQTVKRRRKRYQEKQRDGLMPKLREYFCAVAE
jgi:hypothetical protein